MIKAYKHEGGYASIENEEYCNMESPRVECDNLGTFITWIKGHESPDENWFKSPEEFYESNKLSGISVSDYRKAKMVILPVYGYIHSETRYSTIPFGCPWDSGFAGFIYADYETIREEYGCKYVTKNIISKVKEVLRAEVEAYDQWVNDPTFEVTIYDKNGEMIEGMGGFYYLENAMEYWGISEADFIGEFQTEDAMLVSILKGDCKQNKVCGEL